MYLEENSDTFRIVSLDGLRIKEVKEPSRELALIAVNSNGLALQYLKQEFKDDQEIAVQAIKNNPTAYVYISDRLKSLSLLLFEKKEYGLILAVDKYSQIMFFIHGMNKEQEKLFENIHLVREPSLFLKIALKIEKFLLNYL